MRLFSLCDLLLFGLHPILFSDNPDFAAWRRLTKTRLSFQRASRLRLNRLTAVMKAKPDSTKGNYLLSAAISTTMGPSVKLDLKEIANLG